MPSASSEPDRPDLLGSLLDGRRSDFAGDENGTLRAVRADLDALLDARQIAVIVFDAGGAVTGVNVYALADALRTVGELADQGEGRFVLHPVGPITFEEFEAEHGEGAL